MYEEQYYFSYTARLFELDLCSLLPTISARSLILD